MMGRFAATLGRVRRRRTGGAALEFGLVAPVFLGLLLLAFEILYVIAAKSVIDTALDESSRIAVTGGSDPTDLAARRTRFTDTFYSMTDGMISRGKLAPLMIACSTAQQLNTAPGTCRTDDPGRSAEIVQFSVTYTHTFLAQSAICGLLQLPTCTPLTIHSQLVRRNEPF